MSDTHPMLPAATHDEAAEQLFIRDLKNFVSGDLEPFTSRRAAQFDPGPGHNDREGRVYERLHEDDAFLSYASLRRTSQEMLWDAIGRSVQRQAPELEARAAAAPALGSITLDEAMAAPGYLVDSDVHLMPGGYAAEMPGVMQGAIMDRGGAVYMLGRNGGFMNDRRGRTVISHLFTRFPDVEPSRILELGCGIGASIVPVAEAFPDAEVYGLDVGASMLRYAHARAAHLGAAVHFVQGSAEAAPFPDESFDLVFSAALFHETSRDAIARIVEESHRLLRPGGVAIHLEVPNRYEAMDLWGRIRGKIEHDYNNEPAWREAISADYDAVLRSAGFVDVATGYQDSTGTPERGKGVFSPASKGTFLSWFVASGRR